MAPLIVFDDAHPPLTPLTDTRAAFEVRTGASLTLERIERALQQDADALFVPAELAAVVEERHHALINELPDAPEHLLVNGRCVLPPDALALQPGQALIEEHSSRVIAAHLTHADAQSYTKNWKLGPAIETIAHPSRCLLHHPSDVIRFRDAALAADLTAFPPHEEPPVLTAVTIIGDHPVIIDPTASVAPTVVIDAQAGPVVIDAEATIRPGAIICGPAYVGMGATILDHALIKANTAIGPSCKIAGEVGGTIFQAFSNKAHDGHLGDSWIGEWVNLGAGTTNSNLLNTYSEVSMRAAPNEPRLRTGLTFLGAIIGDHAKTAIATRIMTGSVFGTGAMVASTAAPPTFVHPFSWLTDADGAQWYRFEKFIQVAERVMQRRDIELSDAQRERLRALHLAAAPRG
jgi:UDP-N-acetylglucosamine diphosphorylase/glucosamine-1-phosphate N-acetyltransferase